MTRKLRSSRPGYTLVELTVAVSVATVLMGGLGSAIILASRAIPAPDSPTRATADAFHVAEQIAGELFCAFAFTERSSTAVEFRVHDRDADFSNETIRYAWSGTPGDPLTRQYNGGTAVEIASGVQEFALAYTVSTQSETTTVEGTSWSGEQLLASFDGWAGVTPTLQLQPVNSVSWSSQYFEIVPPADTTELRFTQAVVWLMHGGVAPERIDVGIYRSKGDGSYEPEATAIGTPATIPGASLTTITTMMTTLFSDVVVQDVARTDYCLVLKGSTTTLAYAQYMYSKSATYNAMYYLWTTDGGSSWDPSKNLEQQDLRFYLYGSFGMTGTQEVTVDRYFLTAASIGLQISADTSTRVETSVQVLNAPEVAGS